ncbi:MAG TPA: FAD-binding domain-containing protein, partial [Acidimicrobiales bacterium]|nr:FAD-binding domain-containing protein [Acidimicrobiales bacterium]
GDTVQETLRVASEVGATRLHVSADVTPLGRRRESKLARECGRRRMHFETFPGVTVVPAGELTPAGADHFRVFTPYWNRWRSTPLRPVLPAPVRLPGRLIGREGAIPPRSSITSGSESPGRDRGGETAGRARARRWLSRGDGGVARAAVGGELSPDGSSRLSAYLHFGCVSPNELCHQARGHAELLRQLCWRDFHHQVVAAFPRLGRDDYRPGRRTWRADVDALSSWKEGDTGVPLVDAGMRQLRAEGWMPNRARMLAAYYLTRCLGVDWRHGAEHFMDWLTDADVANNYGNWQWVAGTGNDTRPNRIFNLTRQARRHDPRGEYIRRWLS